MPVARNARGSDSRRFNCVEELPVAKGEPVPQGLLFFSEWDQTPLLDSETQPARLRSSVADAERFSPKVSGNPQFLKAFRAINAYVHDRFKQLLKRRSQRPYHPTEGVSIY